MKKSKREERMDKLMRLGEQVFKDVEDDWKKITMLSTIMQDYLTEIGSRKGFQLEKMALLTVIFHLLNEYYPTLEDFKDALSKLETSKLNLDYNPEDLEE